jgi:alpha-ribazole phosphatase/probable phosphoglycerate mutase
MAELSRIYWVRHGEVEAAWRGKLYGALDVPLSAAGKAQAQTSAAILSQVHLDQLWSSTLGRARFGAEAIAAARARALGEAPLEVRADPQLVELDRGDWAGLTFEELERREPGAFAAWRADPEDRRPPGGESLNDLAERVLAAVDRLAAELDGGAAAVVAHGWVIRVILSTACGLPLRHCTRLKIVPAAISAVDWPTAARERHAVRDARRRHPGPYLAGVDLQDAGPEGRRWYQRPGG